MRPGTQALYRPGTACTLSWIQPYRPMLMVYIFSSQIYSCRGHELEPQSVSSRHHVFSVCVGGRRMLLMEEQWLLIDIGYDFN